jgi:hypothetical protein
VIDPEIERLIRELDAMMEAYRAKKRAAYAPGDVPGDKP